MYKARSRWPLLVLAAPILLIGCSSSPETVKTPGNEPIASNRPEQRTENKADTIEMRKKQFASMQESIHAVAAIPTSKKGSKFDFRFELPTPDWTITTHAMGDRKSSVWLFTSKSTGIKMMLSCAGTKESPNFTKSAEQVYDSSHSKNPSITREWKVGNFNIKRSFIGFIDERHGESTVTAFGTDCTLEFNLASDSMDRDELLKLSDSTVEAFIKKNPDGGFPSH